MLATARWRITLTFGRLEFKTIEPANSETLAIESARRYAAACGYSGHPTRIVSRRIS